MSLSNRLDPISKPNEIDKAAATAIKQVGLSGEVIEDLVKSSNANAREFGSFMHNTSYGKLAHQLGPIGKLLEVVELKENYAELKEHGHSSVASFVGAGAGIAAGAATFSLGASIVTAGVLAAPEVPPAGVAAVAGGALLMHESERVAKMARHHVPIIVDSTLDKFSFLYSSAAQFVQQSYQKFTGNPEYSNRQYQDVETAMLDFGYKDHVKNLYAELDQNQQLLYSTVTRDLFNQYFKHNQDKTMKAENAGYSTKKLVSPAEVKEDIIKVQGKLAKEAELLEKRHGSQVDKMMKEQNGKLKTCLNVLVKEANQKGSGSASHIPKCDPVKSAQEFCDVFNAASQGASLVARLAGNNRVAQQITHSAMGVSQIVMGIAQIAKGGWAAGPVGMALGGINTLISCFGSDGGNPAMEAFAEQLAIISSQIHALHEDMLYQFSKVFTALGVINTNIIEGFKLLHEDQKNIFINIIKLQKCLSTLQDSVNALGHKIDTLGTELQSGIIEDDRKQLQHVFNGVREKARRTFKRIELHTQIMAAFKTFNEELVTRKLSGEKVSAAEITKHLTTKLGSAEANTGLLLNFAKNVLNMEVSLPIADPEQWRECANILIELTDKTSAEKQDRAVIGTQDYEDFRHLRQIGDNWLSVITQFKSQPDKQNKLSLLFQRYRSQVKNLITLVEQEVDRSEQETKVLLKPKHQGLDDFAKQNKFKYDFKRNYYYLTATEDWSGCKGFHNAARFMGYDNFGGEWTALVEKRQKDIVERLAKYEHELNVYRTQHSDDYVQYYSNEKQGANKLTHRRSASTFIISDTASDTSPMLPLPPTTWNIPDVFVDAELLGLGVIKHTYKFEKNEFIYKIQFVTPGEEIPLLIAQFNKPCKLADYLNPAEAIWHAYMGGTYPANASFSLEARTCNSTNGDYFVRQYCAIPTMTSGEGIRNTLLLDKETPKIKVSDEIEARIVKKVRNKKAVLRQTLNEKMLQNLESLDSRNPIASALQEIDASAKMLIAFLSIIFRDNYQRPAAIWTRDDIIDFIKQYQNQDVYLTHQLATNLTVLEAVEKLMLKNINLQTESAYTPVKETLKKLAHFMVLYEKHVLNDNELAIKVKAERNNEIMLYGAAKATLLIQSELIRSGHNAAATHLADLITQSGLILDGLPAGPTPVKRISVSAQGIFATNSNPNPNPNPNPNVLTNTVARAIEY